MAVDYFGSFPCNVRESFTDAELLRMVKARDRARSVLDVIRNDPKSDKGKPESEWTCKVVVVGPDGPKERVVRIQDMLEEAAPLEALAGNCVHCPNNVRAIEFGCGGAVHYPISAHAERWLVSRLPADLESRAGRLLTRAIVDFGYDGAGIDAARARKQLCEANAPVVRKWGRWFAKKTQITSSQIIHMLIGVGSFQPGHAKLVAYFLGFLDDDFCLVDNPSNRVQPGADDQIVAELKYFLTVAARAGVQDAPVLVDA